MNHFFPLTGWHILDKAHERLAGLVPGRPTRNTRQLADDYAHPDGAGAIGPGADGLLRAVLVEALTLTPGTVEIVTTGHDLERLFADMTNRVPRGRFQDTLRVADTLEDAVEYVEARMVEAELRLVPDRTPILWMAAPGADADVVHQALNSRPAASTTGLFKGPWSYGPTHMIEEDGPRPHPHHPVHLLSPQQALARLHAGVPGPRQ